MKQRLESLDDAEKEEHGKLLKKFRTALPRLWFGVLFWPCIIIILFSVLMVFG
jgi:hypothetical protein